MTILAFLNFETTAAITSKNKANHINQLIHSSQHYYSQAATSAPRRTGTGIDGTSSNYSHVRRAGNKIAIACVLATQLDREAQIVDGIGVA